MLVCAGCSSARPLSVCFRHARPDGGVVARRTGIAMKPHDDKLAIVVGWLGADIGIVSKYSGVYNEYGVETLTFVPPPSTLYLFFLSLFIHIIYFYVY